jgi:N-methylhydantoinase A/oxoprolinase/acetone carboxylase beta subunit
MAGSEIVATSKTKTTSDPSASIASAVIPLLQASHVRPVEIDAVMVGIAPLARAFEQRRGLQRVGVLRLALRACRLRAPLSDWPPLLVATLNPGIACLSLRPQGPNDGLMPFDAGELLEAAATLHRLGIRGLALSAPGTPQQRYIESEAATLIRSVFSELDLSLASDFSESADLESENAAVVNAALGAFADSTLRSVEVALKRLRIWAPVFFSRNDGTLASATRTRAFPLFTLASDAANSIRGAVHLSSVQSGVVIDIGGSSTTFGRLVDGFPSMQPTSVIIGGVRLQLPLPQMLSIDVGGGSVIRQAAAGTITIGPDSVGAELDSRACIFGGDTLTATDAAVAAGRLHLGDVSRMKKIAVRLAQQALDLFHARIASGLALATHGAPDLPKVLVGGGALLVAQPWSGWAPQVMPTHHEVVNAIGAATAPLSKLTDGVYSYRVLGREVALAQARADAFRRLYDAGAVEGTAKIVGEEEIPLPGSPGDLVRLRVRASGKPPG